MGERVSVKAALSFFPSYQTFRKAHVTKHLSASVSEVGGRHAMERPGLCHLVFIVENREHGDTKPFLQQPSRKNKVPTWKFTREVEGLVGLHRAEQGGSFV